MPRGIPKAKALGLQFKKAELNIVVPKGAANFPGTTTPIPKGVAIRSNTGVQIEFTYKGVRQYETIGGKPTVGHVQAAVEKRERVIQLIGLGTFDYEAEFPESRSMQQKHRVTLSEDDKNSKITDTIGAALDAWLLVKKPSIGFNSGADYVKDSNRLKLFPSSAFISASENRGDVACLGDMAACDLTDVNVARLQDWLFCQPGAKAGSTLGEKRVRNLMIPLRGAMERLAKIGRIHHNPFSTIGPIKTKNTVEKNGGALNMFELDVPLPIQDGIRFKENDIEVEPFSPVEVAAILGQLHGSFLNMMVFWLSTGLRTGELIALRWSDIDWDGDNIYIQRSLSRGHMKLPKFDKKRWVKLLPPARKALDEQRRLTGSSPGFVFTNPYTNQMWANESKICSRFKKAVELAGVTYRRPYNCRHTYASVMLSSGENPLYVAEQMGHADWSMLIKVYGRWMKGVDHLAGQRAATTHESHWQSLSTLLENRRAVGEEIGTVVESVDGGEPEDDELKL